MSTYLVKLNFKEIRRDAVRILIYPRWFRKYWRVKVYWKHPEVEIKFESQLAWTPNNTYVIDSNECNKLIREFGEIIELV